MTRLLFALGCAICLASCGGPERYLYDGPDGSSQSINADMFVGGKVAWGLTAFSSLSRDEPVTLLSVEPVQTDPSAKLIAVYVAGPDREHQPGLTDECPPNPTLDPSEVEGVEVPYGRLTESANSVALVLCYEGISPGRFEVRGLRVRFRVGDEVKEEVLTKSRATVAVFPARRQPDGRQQQH